MPKAVPVGGALGGVRPMLNVVLSGEDHIVSMDQRDERDWYVSLIIRRDDTLSSLHFIDCLCKSDLFVLYSRKPTEQNGARTRRAQSREGKRGEPA